MSLKIITVIFFAITAVVVLGFLYVWSNGGMAPSQMAATEEMASVTNSVKRVDFSKVNPEFTFSADIPSNFKAEYLSQARAINIFDPAAQAQASQILLTFFKANDFLTLSTVTITRREKMSIQGREAVLYEIEKKPEAANFTGQPEWRNQKHIAIDVRLNENSPTYFYSFAYNPVMQEQIFNDMMNSIDFYEE